MRHFPEGADAAPGDVLTLYEPGADEPPAGLSCECPPINWQDFGTPVSASVVLLDPQTNVVDFVVVGSRSADGVIAPTSITGWEWRGNSLSSPAIQNTGWSYQRAGNRDTGTSADWEKALPRWLVPRDPGLWGGIPSGFAGKGAIPGSV